MPEYVHSDRGAAFMSEQFKKYLVDKNIAQSRTTPYNPTGNAQCERFNGIIWKTVQLATKSRNMGVEHWEEVLPDVLHSLRSLLSTATNVTPHERMFCYPRKSVTGTTLPAWLLGPGKVLYKRQVRHSKNDPLVDEVHLLEANTQYAHIRFPGGRESTVSTKHLAPTAERLEEIEVTPEQPPPQPLVMSEASVAPAPIIPSESGLTLRRSTRTSKPPERLSYD